jgi:hypothetical protein
LKAFGVVQYHTSQTLKNVQVSIKHPNEKIPFNTRNTHDWIKSRTAVLTAAKYCATMASENPAQETVPYDDT